MEPGNYGTASISPDVALAGEKGQWDITYVVGESGIKEGGGLRIIPPTHGTVLWDVGKVLAFCDNPNVHLEVKPENTHPLSYHHSHYPAINLWVYGSDLSEGETIRVQMGAVGGYLSGRFIQARAQTHAGPAPFRVFVDPKGNAHFSRERIRLHACKAVEGDLTVQVKPSREARIRCTIRTSPGEGEDMIGVVSVEDRFENPIVDKAHTVRLLAECGDLALPAEVTKPAGQAGVKFSASRAGSGVARASASDWRHNIYGVSNPVCPGFHNGYRVYFGDVHVMTGAAGNPGMLGNTEGALTYARDVYGLDFSAVTNPVSAKHWLEDQRLFREFNGPHKFVTLPAYERGFRTGHKNIYYLDESLPVCQARDVAELWEFLGDKVCTVISHHTNTHSETDPDECWGPLDISTINPDYERLIEICQNRGSFERDEIGAEVSFGGFGSSIRDVLARGYRLGFVGGTDNHRGLSGSPLSNQSGLDARAHVTGGITAVLCKELTREAIWEALLARRCYATTCVRMLLAFDVNGLNMGEEVHLTDADRERFATRKITIKTAGTYPIARIVIVRNGKEVHTISADEMECTVEWEDTQALADVHNPGIRGCYYYAKAYQHDGNLGWTSPVWLTYEG